MKEILYRIIYMVKVSINGPMEGFMRVIGSIMLYTGSGSLLGMMEGNMLGVLKIIKKKATVNIVGRLVKF